MERRTAISGWAIQSSALVPAEGREVSTPGYAAEGWYPVAPRSTVLAGLLENGVYSDLFTSTNLRRVDASRFEMPWWYRADFDHHPGADGHAWLELGGVISRADLWVNGTQVATKDEIVGAWRGSEIGVTELLRPGTNTVALLVHPNNPYRDLTLGWIDWGPPPPDQNMGLWDDVELLLSGPVALRFPRVLADVALPGLDRADLTVKVDVLNPGEREATATVVGRIGEISFTQEVTLAAGETRTVAFDPESFPELSLADPRIWWPHQLGDQPLYELAFEAHVGAAVSDTAHSRFGIRDVRAPLTAEGSIRFEINGEPLLLRGGGWASDVFLRDQPERTLDQLRYVLDLGLNTVRPEGKLERDDFYDRCDELGILLLPGWECCNKWEAWADVGEGGLPWTPEDYVVARDSMATQARRLHNHPSAIAFLVGSDFAPPEDVERGYVEALRENDWPNPVVSSAADASSPQLGRSGMKMTGPYDWVPPAYWYEQKAGGAFGFNSETSAGATIPTLASVQAMLGPDEQRALWQAPDAPQFHAGRDGSQFGTIAAFTKALAARYGPPTSLEDYVRKGNVLNYEGARAQFEAYIRNWSRGNPSTGVVYWMLNNGWPSLLWNLFTHDLDQPGAYWGAKKANEPLHALYSLDDGSVVVVNHTHEDAEIDVVARVRDLDVGVAPFGEALGVVVPALGSLPLFELPEPAAELSFVQLVLERGGKELSRNVYWRSAQPDVLDWDRSEWYATPASRHADLTSLQDLPPAAVEVAATVREEDGTTITTVTLANVDRSALAFFLTVSLRRADGERILPVRWSDNAVTLWPAESVTLTARCRSRDVGDAAPHVELSGWSVEARRVAARYSP